MGDIFTSPKRRLARADNRISKLDSIIEDFWKDTPYAHWREVNSDGNADIHCLRFKRDVPAICEDTAAEALLALRSCLDQTGYATAIASGKIRPIHTYFPICSGTADEFDNLVNGRCKDLPPEIQTLFRTFQAHKEGNVTLCALNELRNSVHTVFVPNIVSAAGRRIHISSTKSDWRVFEPPIWNREKNLIAYMQTPIGADVAHDVEFALCVSFAEVDAVKGLPAVDVLQHMANEVARVLSATENECRRIGLIT